jgi:drug/metabolite transporter (DMT)-like permease
MGLLVVVLIWGLNFAVVKGALADIPPLAFNALRFPVALIVVAIMIRATGARLKLDRKDLLPIIGLGFLGNVVYQVLFIYGLDLTLAGNAGILLATIPVWTTLLSALVGHERPTPRFWFAVLGTLLGAVLVVSGGSGDSNLGAETLTGDLLILAAAACWAVYTVGSRPLAVRYGSLPVTAWTLMVGTIGTMLVGAPALSSMDWAAVPTRSWFAVVYAGALAIGVAYALWYHSVRRVGSARTAIYGNLVPVIALAGGWALVGEVPNTLQVLGAGTVLGGITLARASYRRR